MNIAKIIEDELNKFIEKMTPRLVDMFMPIVEDLINAAVVAALEAALKSLSGNDSQEGENK